MTKRYAVINVEQTQQRQVWSRHDTIDRAMAAARRYERKNQGGAYGFDVEDTDSGEVVAEHVR